MPNITALQVLISSAARSPGTYYSNGIKVAACHALSFYEKVSAKSGSPTLDTVIQTSPNNVDWSDVNSFTQKTAAGFDSEHMAMETFGSYVRVKSTVGGTGSMTFQIELEKKENYD